MTRKLHNGPPPHIGWWEATRDETLNVWRWWNGKFWSVPAYEHDTKKRAKFMSRIKAWPTQSDIKWTTYWPANARVPRVKP